ncbi:family 3 glycoside hydrolase [Lactifluus volemus]|nr:family 3 glycoside hydrolase [Lactifluus volemus]
MGQVVQGGRNWKGVGVDPFLTGVGSYEDILEIQYAGAQTRAKHFINNEQEIERIQGNSNVDYRTEHEIYVLA